MKIVKEMKNAMPNNNKMKDPNSNTMKQTINKNTKFTKINERF